MNHSIDIDVDVNSSVVNLRTLDYYSEVLNPLEGASDKMANLFYMIYNDPGLYLFVTVITVIAALIAGHLVIYWNSLKTLLKRIQSHKQFRKILTFLEDWFLFFFTATWLISVSQPYGLCVLWRWTVASYMKIRYGALGQIATGLDSAGSVDFTEARQIIKSLKILKGKCSLEEFRSRVAATAMKMTPSKHLQHPKFHQYLSIVGGFYCWKPSKFDITHHVRYIPGLSEDSPSLSETKVMELVSQYSNTPFDDQRALWEILIIPRIHYSFEDHLDGDGSGKREDKFAILVRISHGIGDGFSFLKLVMRDMAGSDAEDYVPPTKKSTSSFLYKFAVFSYLFFKSPRAFYNEMRLKDDNPLHNSSIKMTGEKIHVWSKPLSMDWLKELKTRIGAGMSTILLETLSGACRRYMIEVIGLPESHLPSTISTIIPVPAPNHPDNKLVNKFSIVMMPLALRPGSAVERCRQIEIDARRLAGSPDAYMNLFLMDLVAVFPVSLSKLFIINAQCTTVISNLPGPKKAISIWGYPLMDTMFWLPNVGSSGISVSYLSYEHRMRFGLAIDTGVIQDGKDGADLLLSSMIDDLKILANSVGLSTHDMFLKSEQEVSHPSDSPRDENIPKDPTTTSHLEKDKYKDIDASSEDCGFGDDDGHSSDNSFTTDEDHELESFVSNSVGEKNHNENEMNDVDQRFLMTQSINKCHCGYILRNDNINNNSSSSIINLDHKNSFKNNQNHSCSNSGRS